jgi:thiosulfate dehydrogenase (quinone) large subunit
MTTIGRGAAARLERVEAPGSMLTGTAAKALAVLRISTGFVFLWAFLDKTFGLGYATPSARSWINGGSPTRGFLSSVDVGPFQGAFHSIAGTGGPTGCSCWACSGSASP